MNQSKIRNIAIIAHVDHGKTSLVDALLKQTATFQAHQREMEQTTILDSNDLERERGVTILAKNTAVNWRDYEINILDTPGHSDFSGEVERVLNMADGCVLLVDAAEGVMSQTRFVLRLALELGLRCIVVINKVDKKDQRANEVESEIADLFLELATTEEQLDFPLLFAKGIEGIVGRTVEEATDHSLNITDSTTVDPLFETIVDTVPAPEADIAKPAKFQINALDWDDHKGSLCIGKVFQGTLKTGQNVIVIGRDGDIKKSKITYIFKHHGLSVHEVASADAGEIVSVAGIEKPKIGDTISDPENTTALPVFNISEPTVKMQMMVNTSPFVGKEGQFQTSRQIKDRLKKELETNVGLRVEGMDSGDSVTIVGRGELHIAILIETMRREGYEFALSRPQVVTKEVDGVLHEPWEQVEIDIPQTYVGNVTSAMAERKGTMISMINFASSVRIIFEVATRNIIGFRSELLMFSSGEGVFNSSFLAYKPQGAIADWNRGGAVISHETGTVTAYSLGKIQQRAKMMVNPGEEVYAGQVVGMNTRSEDLRVNVTKGKKLTNMRAAAADKTIVLAPAWKPSLEQFLTIIADDELLEITPKDLRLRKIDLSAH